MSTRTRKIRKLRGRKTGYGAKKKHRASGSRGGKGRAGLMKHKRSYITRHKIRFPGKESMKPKQEKHAAINLGQISNIATKQNLKEIVLANYKVLSTGEITVPVTVKAAGFSEKAVKKIQEAGGKAEQLNRGKAEKTGKVSKEK